MLQKCDFFGTRELERAATNLRHPRQSQALDELRNVQGKAAFVRTVMRIAK